MFSNLLFGLTTLTYIALAVFVIQPANATGERLVGWGMIAFALITAYIVSSLLLTISITTKGVFNWITDSTLKRNTAVAVLWFGMVAGVVICTIIKAEFPNKYQSTGIERLLTYPVYYGAAWLPLLMLVPYAILLNPEWRDTISPNTYKIPLTLGCVIGFLLLIAPNIVANMAAFKTLNSESDIKKSLQQIEYETSLTRLFMFTDKKENEKVRTAALAKIKAQKDLETELIKILEQEDPWYFIWLYTFLADNKVKHPERFVQPVNNSILRLASTLEYEVLNNPWKGEGTYHLLNAQPLFRLLNVQFKDSSAVFRPNILKLQETMQKQPAKRDSDKARFYEARNRYQLAVKDWLDSHKTTTTI